MLLMLLYPDPGLLVKEDTPKIDVVEEHHHRNGFPRAPDPQRLCDIRSGHQDPLFSQDPPLSEAPVSGVLMSVPLSELTGPATKFRSYPHKFCKIIECAKQLAQCEAALDPFPIKALFLDKSAMYITEAITKHTKKGVLIPPNKYLLKELLCH